MVTQQDWIAVFALPPPPPPFFDVKRSAAMRCWPGKYGPGENLSFVQSHGLTFIIFTIGLMYK